MPTLKELDREITKIKQRNARVEKDKEWETSYTRRFLVALFTYLSIGVYLYAVNIPYPWLNAIVPTFAFMLSTLTLPFFKEMWLKQIRK